MQNLHITFLVLEFSFCQIAMDDVEAAYDFGETAALHGAETFDAGSDVGNYKIASVVIRSFLMTFRTAIRRICRSQNGTGWRGLS